MTSNTDGAAQGEWTAEDSGEDWQLWEGDVPIGWAATQARAKQIIADHRKAQTAAALAKALTDIAELWVKYGTKVHLQDAVHIADRALAQFHAATEES